MTFAHDEADIERLSAALRQLADEHGVKPDSNSTRLAAPGTLVTEQAVVPRNAFVAAGGMVRAADATPTSSPLPPGIPVLAPGEIITEAIVDHLQEVVALGGFIKGATDQTLDRFRVVASPG